MEVILGKIDGTSVLCNERFDMADPAPRVIQLHTRATTQPYARNLQPIQLRLKLIESVQELAS
ncbi:MAG: hypothetical protein NVS9B14_00440 [Candidatus Acidiferrum sp.]